MDLIRDIHQMNDWMFALDVTSLLCNRKHCTDVIRAGSSLSMCLALNRSYYCKKNYVAHKVSVDNLQKATNVSQGRRERRRVNTGFTQLQDLHTKTQVHTEKKAVKRQRQEVQTQGWIPKKSRSTQMD